MDYKSLPDPIKRRLAELPTPFSTCALPHPSYLPGNFLDGHSSADLLFTSPQVRDLVASSPALPYFEQYGCFTMAYSLLADHGPVLDHFHTPRGVIGFAPYKNLWIMNADPLCHPSDREEVVAAFVREGRQQGKKILAIQCGIETARIFSALGYRANHMGVETILDVQAFDLKGKSKTKIRRWINTARNAGIIVLERRFCDKGILRAAKNVSRRWLAGKINSRELNIMTRKSRYCDEYMARIFFAYKDGIMMGYIVFDPLCENGRIIGYYADLCRISPDAPNGTQDIIQFEALQRFKEEGCRCLSLGISPLAGIDNSHGFYNPVLSLILAINFRFGNRMYSFKGLEFHKSAYHDGRQSIRRPTYFLTQGPLPLVELIQSFALIGIVPEGGFLTGAYHAGKNIAWNMFEDAKDYLRKRRK
jgi:lysylphosphatidylglycerol synthetase-like protein (DUF2156 family)